MRSYVILIPIAALLGCATTAPPQELVNARSEYARAQTGAAEYFDPAQLHEAKTALDQAEAAYVSDPSAPETVDLAIVAELRTQKAEAFAVSVQATQDKARALKELQATQQEQLANAHAATGAARTQAQIATTDANMTRDQLTAERLKGLDTEAKLKSALATIDKIASVKDTDRGMVISFQGDALFKTAEWKLRPEAVAKLSQIADALKEQERKITIEGNTDNQGGAGQYNQDLSEKRATAVRDFLVSKGIPTDLITSVGYGPTRPVAENTSAEGRAANRRVDIVVAAKR